MTLLTNLHPISVHLPIGLLILASAAALLHMYWRPLSQLRVLTWWPMLIGWISTAVAVLTGLLAQGGLPPQAPYWQILNTHVTVGLAILLIYGALLYRRWIAQPQDSEADPILGAASTVTRLWVTLFLIVGTVLVFLTGWSGGQLVYEWGVGVRGG